VTSLLTDTPPPTCPSSSQVPAERITPREEHSLVHGGSPMVMSRAAVTLEWDKNALETRASGAPIHSPLSALSFRARSVLQQYVEDFLSGGA